VLSTELAPPKPLSFERGKRGGVFLISGRKPYFRRPHGWCGKRKDAICQSFLGEKERGEGGLVKVGRTRGFRGCSENVFHLV